MVLPRGYIRGRPGAAPRAPGDPAHTGYLVREGPVRGYAWLAVSALIGFPLCAAEVSLHGRVVDENDAPVQAARVSVRPPATAGAAASAPAAPWEAQTGPTGAFTLTLPGTGDFLVSVECQGYYALKDRAVHLEAAPELTLVIASVREVFQSENVNAETSPVDMGQAQSREDLSGTEVNDLPYQNSHSLRNSLALMPSVLEDSTGALHIDGSSENQVLYLLNGFNITNPISGQLQTLLAVEGIRSLDLTSGRSSAEFGKGSAGVLAINTESGTDSFHYTATDFIPGLDIQQGLHLGNWYPRLGVSGPIVRGRAWFSDTLESEYSHALVTGLPAGQNTRSGWAGSNLLHGQVNLTSSNILSADFLVNVDNEGRVGLAPLNPVSTTSNVHTREYFGNLRDQVYFGRGVLVEFGLAHNAFSAAQTPQGQSLYVFSPQGSERQLFCELHGDGRARSGPGSHLPAEVPFCRRPSTGGRRRCRLAALQRRQSQQRLPGAWPFRPTAFGNGVPIARQFRGSRYGDVVLCARHLAHFETSAAQSGRSGGLGPARARARLVPAAGLFLVSVSIRPHAHLRRLFRHARCRHAEHAGPAARPDRRHHQLHRRTALPRRRPRPPPSPSATRP